jgi:hypothetical protein
MLARLLRSPRLAEGEGEGEERLLGEEEVTQQHS